MAELAPRANPRFSGYQPGHDLCLEVPYTSGNGNEEGETRMKAKTLLMTMLLLTAQPSLAVTLTDDGMAATGNQEVATPKEEKEEKKDSIFDNDAAVGCASGAAVGSLTLAPGLGTLLGCGMGALIAWLW